MRRITGFILCLVLLSTALTGYLSADDINEEAPRAIVLNGTESSVAQLKPPYINALAAIVMDAASGRVLYEKNAHARRPIASTTKIMTAILAIENGNMDDNVTVSKRAAGIGGSSVGLRVGEVIKLKDLLYGLMLNSGNDAAIAIAEYIGTTVENFAEMMNRKAEELGARDTSYKSPHGLDADGHYSTAYDLALITRYALNNPSFSRIVSTKSIALPEFNLYNTNEMLGAYPGADGVKTGYTGKAGRCLVTSATRDSWRIISVVLGCPTTNIRANSSKSILDFAFNSYKPYTFLKADEIIGKLPVRRGIFKEVPIQAVDGIQIPLTEDEAKNIRKEVFLPGNLSAPVSGGIEIGYMKLILNGRVIAQSPLKTGQDVRRKGFADYLGDILKNWGRLVRAS